MGNQPTEVNGRIELSGLTSQYSNTFLLFKNSEGIDGVEADIWLPSNAPVDTGVLINGIADAGTQLVTWIFGQIVLRHIFILVWTILLRVNP